MLHRRSVRFFVTAVLIAIMTACGGTAGRAEDADTLTGEAVSEMRRSLAPLSVDRHQEYGETLARYRAYYGLNVGVATHHIGTIEIDGLRIAVQVLTPPRPRATAFLVHGYLTHSTLCFRHLAAFLLQNDTAVIMFDLPGHGFSEGTAGDVADFIVYSDIIVELTEWCDGRLPQPWYAIGHSTGGAAIIEFLARRQSPFARHILVDPLVHSVLWNLSKMGFALFGWMMPHLPRIFRQTSADRDYCEFLEKHDPLQIRRVPVTWIHALFEWNKRLDSYNLPDRAIAVIQGGRDSVVDWRYNIPFLKNAFPSMDYYFFENGRHDLLNEIEEVRSPVLDVIFDIMQNAGPTAATTGLLHR